MKNRLWIPVTVVVLLLLSTSAFQVQQNEQALVMRFGAPQQTVVEPGLHFKLPSPIDTVVSIDMRMHMLDQESGEYLTKDKKNLLVDSFLIWSVSDPLKFYKTVGSRAGAGARLDEIMRAVVGDVLSSYDFADILNVENSESGLQRIAADLKAATSTRASSNMGVEIHSAVIKRLNFPDQNKRAVFARMESERQKISRGIRAEGKEEFDKIKAETDRKESEMLAEARRQATEIRGNADAEAAKIYSDAYDADPELYQFLRSLRALESSLSKDSLIILPSDHALLNVMRNPPSTGTSAGAGNNGAEKENG